MQPESHEIASYRAESVAVLSFVRQLVLTVQEAIAGREEWRVHRFCAGWRSFKDLSIS